MSDDLDAMWAQAELEERQRREQEEIEKDPAYRKWLDQLDMKTGLKPTTHSTGG